MEGASSVDLMGPEFSRGENKKLLGRSPFDTGNIYDVWTIGLMGL
jgi:hypothetical protein